MSWLIAYDVSDPKRLARVHRCLARDATPLQYSVFTGTLDERRRQALERRLVTRIDPRMDDVRLYGLSGLPRIRRTGPDPLPTGVLLVDAGDATLAALAGPGETCFGDPRQTPKRRHG